MVGFQFWYHVSDSPPRLEHTKGTAVIFGGQGDPIIPTPHGNVPESVDGFEDHRKAGPPISHDQVKARIGIPRVFALPE